PHDRHRRSEPDRPSAGPDLRSQRRDTPARGRRGYRPCGVHRRGRHPSRAGRAHRAGIRPGGAQADSVARGKGMIHPRGARSHGSPVDIVVESALWKDQRGFRTLLRRAVAEAGAVLSTSDAELAIVLTDDSAVRTLNRKWRGKDEATNVLAFPATQPHSGS